MQMIMSLTIVVSAFMVGTLMAAPSQTTKPTPPGPDDSLAEKIAKAHYIFLDVPETWCMVEELESENEEHFTYAEDKFKLSSCGEDGMKELLAGPDSEFLYAHILYCLRNREQVFQEGIADKQFIYSLGHAMYHDGTPELREKTRERNGATNVQHVILHGSYIDPEAFVETS